MVNKRPPPSARAPVPRPSVKTGSPERSPHPGPSPKTFLWANSRVKSPQGHKSHSEDRIFDWLEKSYLLNVPLLGDFVKWLVLTPGLQLEFRQTAKTPPETGW